MKEQGYPDIRDLAIIGDRRTCALITKEGNICWYCPERFDKAAALFSLIDSEKGGIFSFEYKKKQFIKRYYEGQTGILTSEYEGLKVTDWMPLNHSIKGICRHFSNVPEDLKIPLSLSPDFGNENVSILRINEKAINFSGFYIYSSHPVDVTEASVEIVIPKNDKGFIVLSENSLTAPLNWEELSHALNKTREGWTAITSRLSYEGPYQKEVQASIRAIHLMTYEENGGIIAAGTTSLPESTDNGRNYDYRYVWLRDTAMIVSALTRAGSDGYEERKFLDFICSARGENNLNELLPFFALDKGLAPGEKHLSLNGYKSNKPVRTGNDAKDQLQLDANANVLIAAKLIYNSFNIKDHWETVSQIADFLAENWQRPDHGIWEENKKEHYTSSKVISAKALDFIADYAEYEKQEKKWRNAAKEIRKFIKDNCLTSTGAYAVYPGSEDTDITAALFPVWDYEKPDSPVMLKTIELLEKNYKEGNLYRRHLVEFDSSKEGVFIAGCLWMAQYYLMKEDFEKTEAIIKDVLKFSNDLGLMAEEGNPQTGEMLGNFPQTFAHASFIGLIIDLKNKLQTSEDKHEYIKNK